MHYKAAKADVSRFNDSDKLEVMAVEYPEILKDRYLFSHAKRISEYAEIGLSVSLSMLDDVVSIYRETIGAARFRLLSKGPDIVTLPRW